MKKQISKVVPLSEQWPEVQKLAENLAKVALTTINTINTENNPQIKNEVKGCEYWRQGLLELLIQELQESV